MSDLPPHADHPSNDVPKATNHNWGTVASTRDAATRGSQNSPVTEPMPTPPYSGDPEFKY